MTRSLVLIPRHGDRQFLTKEQAAELLAGVPDYVEPEPEKPAVEPVVPEKAVRRGGSRRGRRLPSLSGDVIFDDSFVKENDGTLMCRQDYFIDYFNTRNRCIACLPDYFAAGLANDRSLIRSLEGNSRSYAVDIICGDRFLYKNKYHTDIIRPYGSTVVKPETVNVVVPVYFDAALNDILRVTKGNDFVRSLFRIDKSIDDSIIEKAFLNLSGMNPDSVKFCTPFRSNRRGCSYVASIHFRNDSFLIDCRCDYRYLAFSRGVRYIPKNGGGA